MTVCNVQEKINTMTNSVALCFESYESIYTRYDLASKVSERFLCAAALLSSGEYLGWQISPAEHTGFSGVAFSGPETKVTAEDYRWIFQQCAVISQMPSAEPHDLFHGNRKVYRLSSIANGSKDAASPKATNPLRRIYDGNYNDLTIEDMMDELFRMLQTSEAIIRIMAGAAEELDSGHGAVLVSLPNEISLRMKSAFSLVFPHIVVEAMDGTTEAYGVNALPDHCFLDVMAKVLCTLTSMPRESKSAEGTESAAKGEDKAALKDENKNTSASEDMPSGTTIEDMDLSVRTYNCLKRAGICTIEELRKMSDYQFMHLFLNLRIDSLSFQQQPANKK